MRGLCCIAAMLLVSSVAVAQDAAYVVGEIEKVGSDYQFTEGPLWVPGEGFLVNDIPAKRTYRADNTVFREDSGGANGMALDPEGRIVICEELARRVTRRAADGTITVLAEKYGDKPLNCPNDVVVRSDGMIFFTDPFFGLPREARQAPENLGFTATYALKPGGEPVLIEKELSMPNGIALSPDEKTLYIADSGTRKVMAYPLAEDGSLGEGKLFCELPGADGMAVDVKGNLWISAQGGVHIFSSAGEKLFVQALPDQPANCKFGGEDMKTMFVAARGNTYKFKTAIAGVPPVSAR